MRYWGAMVVGLLACALGVAWMATAAPAPILESPPDVPAAPGGESMPMAGLRRGALTSVPARTVVQPVGARWQCLGRCVDWQTGEALAGCEVRAAGTTALTGGGGHFALSVPVGCAAIAVTVAAEGRVGVTRTIELCSPVHELSDIALRAAGRVAGMLMDDQGRPCGNRRVVLEAMDYVARQDGWRELITSTLRTRADGSFQVDDPVPAGALQVRLPELTELLGETSHALPAGGSLFLALRCRSWQASDELCGVVRDEAGRAVRGAVVQLATSAEMTANGSQVVHSDGDGRFCFVRRTKSRAPVWLRAAAGQGSLESAGSGPHAWGARPLELVLQRAAGAWLNVVDLESGEPIEAYAVQHAGVSGVTSLGSGEMRYRGVHAGGRCWLPDVGPHAQQVIVWPEDARWLPNLPVAVHFDGATRECTVGLARARRFPVRLVSATLDPIAGATIQLLRPAANDVVRDLSSLLRHGASREVPNVVLATAVTDADGNCSLRWMSDDAPLQLRVQGRGMAPHIEHNVRLQPQVLTLQVAAVGVLHAVLPGAAGRRLGLTSLDGQSPLPRRWSRPLLLDEAGELTVDVPLGHWQVRLMAPLGNGSWRAMPDVLADVRIEAGKATELRRDVAAQFATAELTGYAFVDGQPASQVVLLHGSQDVGGQVRAVDTTVLPSSERGEFRFVGLPAGHYALQVRLRCSAQRVSVAAAEWLQLAAGERHACGTMNVTTAPLVLALQDASQAVVASEQVFLRGANGAMLAGRSDERGVVTFARVPMTSYEVLLRRDQGALSLGRVQPDPGSLEPRVLVVK